MSVREGVRFKGMRSIVALSAALVACTAAAVAMASSTHARLETTQQQTFSTILAGGNGHALYMHTHDQRNKSTCYGTCAQVWPPDYTNGRPVLVPGSGLNSHLLGTTRRRNGLLQVTYNGHPLYFYSQDLGPGYVNGEGLYEFSGYWYVLGPKGRPRKSSSNPGEY